MGNKTFLELLIGASKCCKKALSAGDHQEAFEDSVQASNGSTKPGLLRYQTGLKR